MFKKIIQRIITPRHHWRNVGFSELSELYTNMMFRSLAMSLVAIFIPIYLYQNGSPVYEILYFYLMLHATQLFMIPITAYLIARFGPKHVILSSYPFQTLAFIGLILLPKLDISNAYIGMLFGISSALFFVAFHVDFSKVKHSEHGGKEVGWMFIMQKIGAILGPIVGGVIAFLFGAQYIFAVGLVLLFVGVIPLFFTSEPTKTKQKLDFEGIKVAAFKRDIISFSAFTLESTVTLIVWPLFIGVLIFRENPFVSLGSVSSLSIIASLLAAHTIGSMIDKRKGRSLLQFGAIGNAVLHLFRPFANGYGSVLGINLVNEVVTVAYTMPMTKGMYDSADDKPGFRIVYISTMEAVGAFSRLMFYAAASAFAYWYGGESKSFFFVLFAVGALASLIITTEKFRALNR